MCNVTVASAMVYLLSEGSSIRGMASIYTRESCAATVSPSLAGFSCLATLDQPWTSLSAQRMHLLLYRPVACLVLAKVDQPSRQPSF